MYNYFFYIYFISFFQPIQSSQLCLANLPPMSPPCNPQPQPSYQQPRRNDNQCSSSQNTCNEQVAQPLPERVERPSTSRMHPHTQPIYSVIGEGQNLTGAECTICYENPIDSVLYMCGHMCMCYRCAVQQWRGKGGGQCPLCRAQIKDVIRTYKSWFNSRRVYGRWAVRQDGGLPPDVWM